MKIRIAAGLALAAFLSGCALLGYQKDPVTSFNEYATHEYAKPAAVYGMNERKNKILFVRPDSNPPELLLYETHTDTTKAIRSARKLPGVDEITYEGGAFKVWYQGSALVEVVVDGGRRPLLKKSSDVAKSE